MTGEVFDRPLDLWPGEQPLRARDAAWHPGVRMPGGYGYHATLDVRPLPCGYVRVLWRIDPGDHAPDSDTVFRGRMARRPRLSREAASHAGQDRPTGAGRGAVRA